MSPEKFPLVAPIPTNKCCTSVTWQFYNLQFGFRINGGKSWGACPLYQHASLVSASAWSLAADWALSTYLNSATELPSDSVAQFVGVWQAICQVVGLSPSLSHCLFFPLFIFTSLFHTSSLSLTSDCQVWSTLNIWALCTSRFALAAPIPTNNKN